MKTIIAFFLAVMISHSSFGQVYMTRSAHISFFSVTPMENIKAVNDQAYAVIDAGKKNIAFTLLIKSFQFEKELMQQHFNENYIESDKYPKASFSGSFTGDVNTATDGTYNVTVKGNLTIHNVTKSVEAPATLEVKSGHLIGKTQLKVKAEDYNISIPALVREKIAKEITIDVLADCTLKK